MSFSQSTHRLILGDARDLSFIHDESVHLVVTSPPYWTLKKYREHAGQLGHVAEYEEFLEHLGKTWKHCLPIQEYGSGGSGARIVEFLIQCSPSEPL